MRRSTNNIHIINSIQNKESITKKKLKTNPTIINTAVASIITATTNNAKTNDHHANMRSTNTHSNATKTNTTDATINSLSLIHISEPTRPEPI
eukprot:7145733-Pyramimonas_sp.AAC.1